MNARIEPIDRECAWSDEAEIGVAGSMLWLGAEAVDVVGDMLTPAHFHDGLAGRIYAAALALGVANKPVDSITVFDELKRTGMAAGAEFADVHAYVPEFASKSTLRRYAEIVVERATVRALLTAAEDVRTIALEPGTSVASRVGLAQARIEQVQTSRPRSGPRPVSDFVVDFLDRLQDMADGLVQPGIPTHIERLNDMLGGGLNGGQQIIIAARPSVGKSSFAQDLCMRLALSGTPAAILSMEMTGEQLMKRAVANLARVPLGSILAPRRKPLADEQWGRVADAIDQIRTLPLYLDEQPGLSLHDIAAKARELKRQHGIKVLTIDYLQLADDGRAGDRSRHHQLEILSRGLKALAKQLDITIFTLSQLNREVEKRTVPKPVLSDLKESGAIEEDADVVLMLWRHATTPDGSVIGCSVAKNRQGCTGEIALHFEGAYQRWSESSESLERANARAPRTRYADDY